MPDYFLPVGEHYPLVRKEVSLSFLTGKPEGLRRVTEVFLLKVSEFIISVVSLYLESKSPAYSYSTDCFNVAGDI